MVSAALSWTVSSRDGDRVIATARMPEALASELEPHGDQALVLALDVNDSAAVDPPRPRSTRWASWT